MAPEGDGCTINYEPRKRSFSLFKPKSPSSETPTLTLEPFEFKALEQLGLSLFLHRPSEVVLGEPVKAKLLKLSRSSKEKKVSRIVPSGQKGNQFLMTDEYNLSGESPLGMAVSLSYNDGKKQIEFTNDQKGGFGKIYGVTDKGELFTYEEGEYDFFSVKGENLFFLAVKGGLLIATRQEIIDGLKKNTVGPLVAALRDDIENLDWGGKEDRR